MQAKCCCSSWKTCCSVASARLHFIILHIYTLKRWKLGQWGKMQGEMISSKHQKKIKFTKGLKENLRCRSMINVEISLNQRNS